MRDRARFFLIHTNKHKGEGKGGSNKKEVWFVPANQSECGLGYLPIKASSLLVLHFSY